MRLKTPLNCYSNTDLVYIFSILVLSNTKIGLMYLILVLKYTRNMSRLHCSGVFVTLKKGNDNTEYV